MDVRNCENHVVLCMYKFIGFMKYCIDIYADKEFW